MSSQQPPVRPPYQKPWLSHADQVAQLAARGLTIPDPAAAEQFLRHVNYYRFSGYCLAFEQQRHQFNNGCTFDDVRSAYDFDLVLRDIVTDALELLEVDFRAAIAYDFGQKHGPFGHVDPAKFFNTFRHSDWLDRLREEANRSSELFVAHFRNTYVQFPDLPIWMAMEVMSFGGLSQMFKGMHRIDQRTVAHRYKLQAVDLVAVFHHLVYVRNLCAHHSRLWDRVWAIKPSLPKGKDWQPPQLPSNDRLFASLLLQYHLMKQCPAIAPQATAWRDRVKQHLAAPPTVPDALRRMGMPANWDQHPVWQ